MNKTVLLKVVAGCMSLVGTVRCSAIGSLSCPAASATEPGTFEGIQNRPSLWPLDDILLKDSLKVSVEGL